MPLRPWSAANSPAARPAPDAGKKIAEKMAAARGSRNRSNALAVGSQGVSEGTSMLLGNPHFPWAGRNRMWESQPHDSGQRSMFRARACWVSRWSISGTMTTSRGVIRCPPSRRSACLKRRSCPGIRRSISSTGKVESMNLAAGHRGREERGRHDRPRESDVVVNPDTVR